MRAIFRKIYRKQPLLEEEIDRLMDYASELGKNSPPAYTLFYDRFAALLFNHYNLFLPVLYTGFNDWIDFLLAHPEIRQELLNRPMALAEFPIELQSYLQESYGDLVNCGSLIVELETDLSHDIAQSDLPASRLTPLTCKFESGNPFKETGLKAHFDRIGRYSFVSRIHSIRYLTGTKASEDKLEMVSGDCLAGIFTNKEKSIYYYVFLTEKDENKARNACWVLNRALYGYHAEP